MYEKIVNGPQISELIASGDLVGCDVIAPPSATDALASDPTSCVHGPTVIFCASVPEAQALAEKLPRAACVHGEMDIDERREVLVRFARRELDVLTNVYVLTEGWDCPSVETIVLARGCGTLATYLQIVGRGLRASPGKTKCTLYDLRGQVHIHGLPTDDREWVLEGTGTKPREKRQALARCRKCGAVFAAKPKCPRCGCPVTVQPRVQRTERAEMSLVTAPVPLAEKRAYFRSRVAIARERGYRDGWIGFQFKAKFGHWPRSVDQCWTHD
jgi:superfamily II DNA or RNA helicase